jgi:hypothetical protein
MRVGQLLQIGFFLAFLYTGLVLMLLFGGEKTVSETENRTLAALPKWSSSSLWSGDYFRDMENYAADHVAFRDVWVGASKTIDFWQGITGKDDAVIVASGANNGAESQPPSLEMQVQATAPVPMETNKKQETQQESGRVVGKVLVVGNRAMNLYTYVPAAGKAYADMINQFQQEAALRFGSQMRVSVLISPSAVEFVHNPALKKLSPSQKDAINATYRQFNRSVITVDALRILSDHSDEDLYFRTDHHWTATGAYYAYAAFMNARDLVPVPLTNYKTVKVTGFLGSLYSSTLNKKLEMDPDTIVLYKPYIKHEYIVHYEGSLTMNLLDMNHANKKNKYRIFLSGDRPWAEIHTETDNNRRIAVIKDSFGNAFIPFLLPHFKEIIVIDPRQFKQPLLDFLEKRKVNEVLFINNVGVTSDTGFTDLIRKAMNVQK